MKKQIIVLSLCLFAGIAFSQSIDEGKKMMYYGRSNSAEENFRKLIIADPGNREAYYWLTKVLIEKNNLAEANKTQQQLQSWLVSNPKQKALPLNEVSAGELLLREKKLPEAKAAFDRVLNETRYKKPEVLIAVSRACLDAKSVDYNYILDLLDKAEKRDKKNPEIFVLRGEVYRRLNDGGRSVQSYLAALDKDASNAEALYSIGKIYLTQNNPEMFLKYFNEAITKDPAYAPAYYELYYYYYFRDVNKAKGYLDQYVAKTDPSVANEYLMTDFLYASSQPQQAIEKAKSLLEREKENAQPRLFKLIAYSYDALGDSTKALEFLQRYFQKEVDSNHVAKDFELKANLLAKFPGNDDEVAASLQRALEMDTVSANKVNYASQVARFYKKLGNKSNEAKWLGRVYQLKEDPTNIDLYYWGVAHYSAGEYQKADTVFSIYTEKHPEHVQGFYWRAKANALIDSTMENGLAIPYYQKVIEMASADTVQNKSLLIQAYGYIGAYLANVRKDYDTALTNFDKILQLDANNADAIRYRDILLKWVQSETSN